MSKKIISLQPPCTISEEEIRAFISTWGSLYGTYKPTDIDKDMCTHLETDSKIPMDLFKRFKKLNAVTTFSESEKDILINEWAAYFCKELLTETPNFQMLAPLENASIGIGTLIVDEIKKRIEVWEVDKPIRVLRNANYPLSPLGGYASELMINMLTKLLKMVGKKLKESTTSADLFRTMLIFQTELNSKSFSNPGLGPLSALIQAIQINPFFNLANHLHSTLERDSIRISISFNELAERLFDKFFCLSTQSRSIHPAAYTALLRPYCNTLSYLHISTDTEPRWLAYEVKLGNSDRYLVARTWTNDHSPIVRYSKDESFFKLTGAHTTENRTYSASQWLTNKDFTTNFSEVTLDDIHRSEPAVSFDQFIQDLNQHIEVVLLDHTRQYLSLTDITPATNSSSELCTTRNPEPQHSRTPTFTDIYKAILDNYRLEVPSKEQMLKDFIALTIGKKQNPFWPTIPEKLDQSSFTNVQIKSSREHLSYIRNNLMALESYLKEPYETVMSLLNKLDQKLTEICVKLQQRPLTLEASGIDKTFAENPIVGLLLPTESERIILSCLLEEAQIKKSNASSTQAPEPPKDPKSIRKSKAVSSPVTQQRDIDATPEALNQTFVIRRIMMLFACLALGMAYLWFVLKKSETQHISSPKVVQLNPSTIVIPNTSYEQDLNINNTNLKSITLTFGPKPLYKAMSLNKKDDILRYFVQLKDSNITKDELLEIVKAKNSEGFPGLYLALKYNMKEAISAYFVGLKTLGYSTEDLLEIVEAKNPKGFPGLTVAIENNRKQAISAYFVGLSSLGFTNEVLLEIVKAKNPSGCPGLYWALEYNRKEAISAYFVGFKTLGYSTEDLLEIVKAKSPRGFPGLYTGLAKNSTEAISAYFVGLRSLNYTKEVLLEIVEAKNPNGRPGLFAAMDLNSAKAIRAYFVGLRSLDFTKEDLLKIVKAKDPDGFPALNTAIEMDSSTAIRAYFVGLRSLGYTKEEILNIIEANHYRGDSELFAPYQQVIAMHVG